MGVSFVAAESKSKWCWSKSRAHSRRNASSDENTLGDELPISWRAANAVRAALDHTGRDFQLIRTAVTRDS